MIKILFLHLMIFLISLNANTLDIKEMISKPNNKVEEYNKKAIIYIYNKDYINALKELNIGINKLDSVSLYNLGVLYYNGKGVSKDYNKAKELMFKAAELNDDLSIKLGLFIAKEKSSFNNEFKENNIETSLKLFEKASNNNSSNGNTLYGLSLINGIGIKQDLNKAKELFLKGLSLNENDPDALNNLGMLYSNGFGVTKDIEKALTYWLKSINLGNKYAKGNLFKLCQSDLDENIKIKYCNIIK